MILNVHEAWKRGLQRPCIVIPCGGGKSVIAAEMAKRTTGRNKQVLFLVHRQELCEQITKTFAGHGVDLSFCQVGMVQTVTRRVAQIAKPELIITDENHHCLAKSYRKIYEAFPRAYCVGLTATPVRLNGSGLGDVNDCLIIGPSVKELISQRCLSPFDYYAPTVADVSGLRSRAGDFIADEAAAVLDKPHIYGDIIQHYRNLANGKKAICYCPNIRYSQTMAGQFRKAGISAEHIDGDTPKPKRQQVVESFRAGDIQVLCNVDLISEGFDVPDCGASILLRPTKSLTLYIQQSMRCMRYQPGKQATIIDHVANVFRFGLPDMDREWSLKPTAISKRQQESQSKVKQCPRCFFTHKPEPVCPNCGHIYEPERRSPKEIKEAQLQKITKQVSRYRSPDECGSVQELYAYAKAKGYKPGWGYYQAKQRGLL